ncbi:MAG: RNA polymerase factor sigma-54 [Deltaproteobacteria bacterium]|nr:RNA polymerase factor sigma-54 [Deltaproteobacteria bacterium]
MALEIRQNLKLSQRLVITPQLQQSIKLLQLTRLELLETVREELLENPVLEEVSEGEEIKVEHNPVEEFQENENPLEKNPEAPSAEVMNQKEGEIKEPKDFDWENYFNTYNNSSEGFSSPPEDATTFESTLSQKSNLNEHLMWQLQLSNFDPEQENLAALLISSINEDGYLQDSLEELSDKANCAVETLETVLEKVQKFDPPGVGARTVQECLLLQIRYFGYEKQALEHIVKNHLHELERKDYRNIAKNMKISLDKVIELAKIIHELEPKPGRSFSDSSAEYITPDAYIYKIGREWVVVLNEDGLPKLQVSSFYKKLAHTEQAKGDAKDYVQNKLRSAVWLIKSIHQRQRTLYKVVKAILKFQRDFLEKGVEYLKPMVLKDIAEEIEMHESTVSRVTTNKYLHTPRGLFELKYFFNNGVSNEEGNSIASESIKNKLKRIIEQENPRSPYSDQHIVELLKQSKMDLARRTVAKYREMLGILPSSKRKQLF